MLRLALRPLLALLALLSLGVAAATSPLVVVHGKASIPAEGERPFALSLARHAVRWYREGGLEADLADDADLATTLKGRKVAVLVYCNTPDAKQMAALRSFVRGGGRLIVTYSHSEELADLVGVRMGSYLRAGDGDFHTMQFITERPVNIPPSIRQTSSNIITASPVKGRSTVLAWWVNRAGKRTVQPAWLKGDGGYWMTHVLLADGESAAKGHLLVALAASFLPDLWSQAAANRLQTACAAGPWKSPGDGLARTAQLQKTPRVQRVRQLLDNAEQSRAEAVRMLSIRRGAEAWMLANEVSATMAQAYGMLQQPVQGEIRAVWDHSGQGLYPGDWPRTCRVLRESGVTDLFLNVAGPGFAHCAIDAFPRSALFGAQGDQLKACLAAARPMGIRVHAWVICFSTTLATPARMGFYQQKKWLLDTTTGKIDSWLDPSEPLARAQIVAAIGEILARYRVDGIHLDFVRYPNYYGSLGEGTRLRFEASRGKAGRIANWPDDVKRGALFQELVRWRARQVTALVADVRATQRRIAPRTTVSAAVLGKYPACVQSVGQDWMAWLESGYIDYACPMNYTESPKTYAELLALQLRDRKTARRIIGGIGVTAAESRLAPDQVIDQVKALRAGGAAGFALFDLDTTLEREILPILRLGVCADPRAEIPPR